MIAEAHTKPRLATHQPTFSLLSPDEFAVVLAGYQNLMDVGSGTESRLREALAYILANPGSLVRAQLAYRILCAHAIDQAHALAVGVAIEYFHTASLVFDDMPPMDNANERRGNPCTHVLFGEATATLAGLALINRGYALLWGVLGTLPESARLEASRLVTTCLGVQGILNGQSRDLHFHTSARRERDVLEVAEGKTVTLIRLTLLLPAWVSGVTPQVRGQLEELATLWGLSYQIMDDFKDSLMTPEETGKTADRDSRLHRPNLPAAIGLGEARTRLDGLMADARRLVNELRQDNPAWHILHRLQLVLDRDQHRIQTRLSNAAA
jgi:geranylgeranyl pyrophosphate synthase